MRILGVVLIVLGIISVQRAVIPFSFDASEGRFDLLSKADIIQNEGWSRTLLAVGIGGAAIYLGFHLMRSK